MNEHYQSLLNLLTFKCKNFLQIQPNKRPLISIDSIPMTLAIKILISISEIDPLMGKIINHSLQVTAVQSW